MNYATKFFSVISRLLIICILFLSLTAFVPLPFSAISPTQAGHQQFTSFSFDESPDREGDTPPVPGDISGAQAVVLGVIASALIFLLNIYVKSKNKKIPREALTILVYGLSVVMAFIWTSPALPTIPTGTDPANVSEGYVTFALLLLKQGALILGFATMLYNWLLKRLDKDLTDAAQNPKPSVDEV